MYRAFLQTIGRGLVLTAALAATAGVAAAQGSAVAPTAPSRAVPTVTGANVAKGRVAIINITAFPARVGEMRKAIEGLNARFEPRTRDLKALRDRLQDLEAQAKVSTNPQNVAQLSEQYQNLKVEFDRKNEDLNADGEKAYTEVITPIRMKMTEFLKNYAQQRGIVLVIEASNAYQAGAVVYASRSADITEDFCAEYNKANPVK